MNTMKLYTLDSEAIEKKLIANTYNRVRKLIRYGKILKYKRLFRECQEDNNTIKYATRVIKTNGVRILDA